MNNHNRFFFSCNYFDIWSINCGFLDLAKTLFIYTFMYWKFGNSFWFFVNDQWALLCACSDINIQLYESFFFWLKNIKINTHLYSTFITVFRSLQAGLFLFTLYCVIQFDRHWTCTIMISPFCDKSQDYTTASTDFLI